MADGGELPALSLNECVAFPSRTNIRPHELSSLANEWLYSALENYADKPISSHQSFSN